MENRRFIGPLSGGWSGGILLKVPCRGFDSGFTLIHWLLGGGDVARKSSNAPAEVGKKTTSR